MEDVTVIAIAKGPLRNAGKETFYQEGRTPFKLPDNSPCLHFLQRLRDEAHRYAIGSHRLGRQKSLTKSQLDYIPGIGPHRKKLLLKHFGSARDVAAATLKDLQIIPGINIYIAKKVYDFFHSR